jgi:hypothetical protein
MVILVAAVLGLAAMGTESNSGSGPSPPFEQILKIDVHSHVFNHLRSSPSV